MFGVGRKVTVPVILGEASGKEGNGAGHPEARLASILVHASRTPTLDDSSVPDHHEHLRKTPHGGNGQPKPR